VKVKKEKKNNNLCSPSCSWNGFCIHQKKRIGKKKCIVSEKNGNYVNGENIDKIKFPCFCSFSHPRLKDLRYGIITNTGYHCGYALIDVGSQSLGVHQVNTQNYLEKLIKEWDIHILKGKIIIFEEEK